MPDLHEELSLVGELQDLVVLLRVSAQPHVIFVIDEDSVLRGRPLAALPGAAPRLEESSVRGDFQHGWRRNAALGLWRNERGRGLADRDCRRAVEAPPVTGGIAR